VGCEAIVVVVLSLWCGSIGFAILGQAGTKFRGCKSYAW
jgi:hypothetical protein